MILIDSTLMKKKDMMERKGLGFCQKGMATKGPLFILIIAITITIIMQR